MDTQDPGLVLHYEGLDDGVTEALEASRNAALQADNIGVTYAVVDSLNYIAAKLRSN